MADTIGVANSLLHGDIRPTPAIDSRDACTTPASDARNACTTLAPCETAQQLACMRQRAAIQPQLQQLFSLFDQAVDLDDVARFDLLARLRLTDTALADELQRMLEVDDGASREIRRVVADGAQSATHAIDHVTAGDAIDGYSLIEEIGAGGMGTVYRARRVPGTAAGGDANDAARDETTDVAIKVMRPGLGSNELHRRFARERDVLSRLNHPGVSRLHSSGVTASGLPYYVMDFIPSRPLDVYCVQTRATLRTRLALVDATCRILAHAHAQDILHRDIKPSNILVTEHDARVRPVVIDFGIAHALDKEGNDEQLTMIGKAPGTPVYMSPEQRTLSSTELDGRCDVYGLGVVLFELLTGSLPGSDPRPSAYIASLGEGAQAVAHERQTSPPQLDAVLRNVLDQITVRALESDRRYRYGSAQQMADALERVLESRAI